MAKLTTAEFIDAIKELSVLELNDLVKACEEEFGVSAAAGVVVAAAGGDAAAAEEKTEFDVELTEVGPNKVKVIKVVREITGLGLKEAKDAVDGAPKVIKEQADKASAEDAKAKLEAEGAKVTLKQSVRKRRETNNNPAEMLAFLLGYFIQLYPLSLSEKVLENNSCISLDFVVQYKLHYCGALGISMLFFRKNQIEIKTRGETSMEKNRIRPVKAGKGMRIGISKFFTH